MTRHRNSCIIKTNRTSAHERIHRVGGVNPDGTRWKLSQADAIASVKDGMCSFFVEQAFGHRVDVVVATTTWVAEHLKTTADGEQPNNLLSLSECP